MFSISRAKGKTRLHSRGRYQSIGKLNAVGELVLFDEGGGGSTDGFGKGKNSELELTNALSPPPTFWGPTVRIGKEPR